MNVSQLDPAPNSKKKFAANQRLHIPSQSGCYVLSTFDEIILYIGLSISLVRRFEQHLDDDEKTRPTRFGTAFWFHWLLWDDKNNLKYLERTWLNSHETAEGKLPILNKQPSSV